MLKRVQRLLYLYPSVELERTWKDTVVASFKALFWHLLAWDKSVGKIDVFVVLL
jgi:hypothetical protein